MAAIQSPKTIAELVKLAAKHGKRAYFVSGVDPGADRIPAGKTVLDIGGISALNEAEVGKDKVVIGTGLNLGRVAREAGGENGLIRQAASLLSLASRAPDVHISPQSGFQRCSTLSNTWPPRTKSQGNWARFPL